MYYYEECVSDLLCDNKSKEKKIKIKFNVILDKNLKIKKKYFCKLKKLKNNKNLVKINNIMSI
jgi:hypothetical protein